MRRLAMVLALCAPAAVGGWVLHDVVRQEAGRALFGEVLERVRGRYIDEVSDGDAWEAAARGLVDRIGDPYAGLLSPEELARYSREDLRGEYGGLGMLIQDQDGTSVVTQVFPRSPAEMGGVITGDLIVAVDGRPVGGLGIDSVSALLLGPVGTPVEVRFARRGTEGAIQATFERAAVHQPAVPYAIVLAGGVGYLPIQQFSSTSAQEALDGVRTLLSAGATSIIVDLRGNGGGNLADALLISDFFLEPGRRLLTVRFRGRPDEVYEDRFSPLAEDLPIVVLVDGYSASASEIVAGALQDHDRALVIGRTTFGKGLVQEVFPLDRGWALRLTTGTWLTPSGRLIQRERDEALRPAEGLPLSERPVFRSAAGRPVYGGGGITPDVIVRSDTLSTSELMFRRALGEHARSLYVAMFDLAQDLKGDVEPDFEIRPEWRDRVWRRLEADSANVSRDLFDRARPMIDMQLRQQILSLAFGDSAAYRAFAPLDAPVRRALELLRGVDSQEELFAMAESGGGGTPGPAA